MLHSRYFLLFVIICFANCDGYVHKSITQEKKARQEGLKSNSILLLSGIDFTAMGNNPIAWDLKINFEDSIYFTAQDGNKFTIAANKSKIQKKENEIRINTELKSDSIEIIIEKAYCSDKQKSQKTTVQYRTKTYTGCGLYLQNAQLQNKWILYKFRNKFVDELVFVPTLLLELDNNKMIWNDACITLKSKIKIEGEKIFFKEITQQNKDCSDTEITKVFTNNISQGIATYYFKNDMLYLYLVDDSLLIFKKSN
jgi:uncharacterized membrane protein